MIVQYIVERLVDAQWKPCEEIPFNVDYDSERRDGRDVGSVPDLWQHRP